MSKQKKMDHPNFGDDNDFNPTNHALEQLKYIGEFYGYQSEIPEKLPSFDDYDFDLNDTKKREEIEKEIREETKKITKSALGLITWIADGEYEFKFDKNKKIYNQRKRNIKGKKTTINIDLPKKFWPNLKKDPNMSYIMKNKKYNDLVDDPELVHLIKLKNMELVMTLYQYIPECYLTKNENLKVDRISNHIIMTYDIKAISEMKDEILMLYDWYYNKKIPNAITNTKISTFDYIQKILEKIYPHITNYNIKEIMKKIMRRTKISIHLFNPNYLINFKNGVLNSKSMKLSKPKKGQYFTYQHPISYIKTGNKPIDTIQHLRDRELTDEEIMAIQELIGLAIANRPLVKSFFVFLGDTDTGKGFVVKLIREIIGENRFTNYRIKDLINSKYNLANTHGQRILWDDEFSKKFLNDDYVDFINLLTGMGNRTSEVKYMQDPLDFQPCLIPVFTTNELFSVGPFTPKIKALMNRLNIIEFSFPLPIHDQISEYEKILVEKEGSELVEWGLDGLKRYIRNGNVFSNYSEPLKKWNFIKMRTENELMIIKYLLEYTDDEDDYVLKDDIFIKYQKIADKYGHTILTGVEFWIQFWKWIKNYDLDKSQVEGQKIIKKRNKEKNKRTVKYFVFKDHEKINKLQF